MQIVSEQLCPLGKFISTIPGILISIISTFYLWFPGEPFLEYCCEMQTWGISAHMQPRRVEIRAWLKKHPKVTRFAVIDDEDDELDELPLFQPSAATGLTDKIDRGVAKYLDGTTDEDMRSGPVERFLQNMQSALKGHQG